MRRLLVIVAIFLLFITVVQREYAYYAYSHLLSKIGVDVNGIASDEYVSFIKSQSDELENEQQSVFLNKKTEFTDQVGEVQLAAVLGDSSYKNKVVDVDLSEQRLRMKEGEAVIGSFLISSGKWNPTPIGSWPIWTKLRYTRMKGGSKALGTFYDLVNVPYTMYFNQGYGIHGAYWHNNFGHPMSHGCINMKPKEAAIVYNWANIGTQVVVHE